MEINRYNFSSCTLKYEDDGVTTFIFGPKQNFVLHRAMLLLFLRTKKKNFGEAGKWVYSRVDGRNSSRRN